MKHEISRPVLLLPLLLLLLFSTFIVVPCTTSADQPRTPRRYTLYKIYHARVLVEIRYRVPEPVRQADMRSREVIRAWLLERRRGGEEDEKEEAAGARAREASSPSTPPSPPPPPSPSPAAPP